MMFFLQLIQCQKKDNIMESLPKYNVQVCHPNPDYGIDLVSDKIKTLEGVHATLPYGGSSGRWGDSGKGWTEQYGTPIGADIVVLCWLRGYFLSFGCRFPSRKDERNGKKSLCYELCKCSSVFFTRVYCHK